MAALLSSLIGDTDSVVKYINEARELGLEVLPPDVNESGYKFTVVGDKRIRFGLGAIRNVGKRRDRLDHRGARGAARSRRFFDLCERVDLRVCNKRVFEALIAAGALDGLGGHRAQYWPALDPAIRRRRSSRRRRRSGQVSLFGGTGRRRARGPHGAADAARTSRRGARAERLAREKEILGFYISGHPLEPFRTECELFATHTVAQLGQWTPEPMALGVVVTAIKRQISKRIGRRVRPVDSRGFLGIFRGAGVSRRPGRLLADRVRTDVPVLVKGGYSQAGPGRGESDVHRRVGDAASPSSA